MINNMEFIKRLRNNYGRYTSDNEYSVGQLACDCAEAADIIEQLEEELKRYKHYVKAARHNNRKLTKELKFTREFVLRHGLQYALAAEWNNEKSK